jgi:NAD-dependent SIR2 family protein deacetylase
MADQEVLCTAKLAQELDDRISDIRGEPHVLSLDHTDCLNCKYKFDASKMVKEIEDLERFFFKCCKTDAVCELCGEIDSTKLHPDVKSKRWLCETCTTK